MFKNKNTLIIALFCALKLLLHLFADSNSGFQGDELLHIATGNHPAWGYMEFPPVIGWLAFLQNQLHSSSVLSHHLFTHLAAVLILLLVALVTLELGGGTRAVFVALLCVLVAPAFGRSQQLFQPVVLSQLFWILAFYQLVRFVKTLAPRYVLYLALTLAGGFMSKYDIVFFIAGLAGLLAYARLRIVLLGKAGWLALALFLLLISPNLWWQHQHDYPVLHMFSRLYDTQLERLTVGGVLQDLLISLNPVTAVVWGGGLVFVVLLARQQRIFQPLALAVLLPVVLLALAKSKAYYFYPAVLVVLAFGGVWVEQRLAARRPWLLYPLTLLLLVSGGLIVPFGLALMPVQSFIRYAHTRPAPDGHYPVKYQEYYAQQKWQHTLTALRGVYNTLPAPERTGCLIWGKHYSQAGGVNLYGPSYGLPAAFSYHGSFYLWAPPAGALPTTVIAFTNGEAGIDFFEQYFGSVKAVRKVYNPYADFDKDLWQTIYVCQKPRQDFAGLKVAFRDRVFE